MTGCGQRVEAERRLRLLAIGVAGLFSQIGCEALIGADFDDAEARVGSEAGAGVTCELEKPTAPPSVSGAGGDVQFALVVSLLEFNEGEREDGTPEYLSAGYDLDGICASRGEDPPCAPADWTGGVPADGFAGQDNAVGKVLFEQERFLGVRALTTELLNARLGEGAHAPLGLIRVSGYSGLSEDDRVTVDWYAAHKPEASGLAPLFDGSDRWPILESAVDGTAEPGDGEPASTFPPSVWRDENAYVTKFELVARFDQAVVAFANFYLSARELVLTGRLTRDPTTRLWNITDGVVSGLARADDLVAMLPVGAFETADVTLCRDNPNYDAVKHLVCSVADTVLEGQPEPDGVCGGTSFGIGVEAVESALGPALPDPPPLMLCSPETDPAGDTCQVPVQNPVGFPDD